MIRISDIIKMGSDNNPGGEEKDKGKHYILEKVLKYDTDAEMKQLYGKGIEAIKEIFEKLRQIKNLSSKEAEEYIAGAINFPSLTNYISKLVDYILVGDGELFNYFYPAKDDNYLYQHSLNVCLLSIKIGTWLEMNKSDLVNIGTGALLHDIGLVTVEDIILLPRQLEDKERQAVKKHPEYSANILKKIKDTADDIIVAVKSHHKRLSDKDFTKAIGDDKLQKIVQIIGLADIYEAVTHPRQYKPAKLPYEAVKELIEKEADNFHTRILKSLIDNIGIYPIGSWVRLTNGEIGIVVSTNKGYPLRPRVNIIFDVESKKLNDIKNIDLLEKPHLHIESPVNISDNKMLTEQLR